MCEVNGISIEGCFLTPQRKETRCAARHLTSIQTYIKHANYGELVAIQSSNRHCHYVTGTVIPIDATSPHNQIGFLICEVINYINPAISKGRRTLVQLCSCRLYKACYAALFLVIYYCYGTFRVSWSGTHHGGSLVERCGIQMGF